MLEAVTDAKVGVWRQRHNFGLNQVYIGPRVVQSSNCCNFCRWLFEEVSADLAYNFSSNPSTFEKETLLTERNFYKSDVYHIHFIYLYF